METRSFIKKFIHLICRLFLIMIVLCMMAEVGGIIALSVFNKTVSNKTKDRAEDILSKESEDLAFSNITRLKDIRS